MSRSKKKKNSLIATYAALILMASFIVVPVLWFGNSFCKLPEVFYCWNDRRSCKELICREYDLWR